VDGGAQHLPAAGVVHARFDQRAEPYAATGLDPVGKLIYVANVGDGTVTVVDGVTDHIVGTATVAQAMGGGLAVYMGRVYVEEHFSQPRTLKVFER
jgi:YVTN family beta-propeller protein